MMQDLFSSSCRKQCIPSNASDEIEIFKADQSEELTLQEEVVTEEATEQQLDMEALKMELECMKQRIQLLQLSLKSKTAECTEQPCVDLSVELSCSENKEICALQKDQSKLQYQIEELIRCCCFTKEQIQDLRYRMCEKSKDIAQLQRIVGLLESWRKSLDNEFGVCLERFEYLKHVKAEREEMCELITKYNKCWHTIEQSFVHKCVYELGINKCKKDTDGLREMFKSLCILQMERSTDMSSRMKLIEMRLEKVEALAKKRQTCEVKQEPMAKSKEDFDFAAAFAYKDKYESSVPVHKVFLGQTELYTKSCGK